MGGIWVLHHASLGWSSERLRRLVARILVSKSKLILTLLCRLFYS